VSRCSSQAGRQCLSVCPWVLFGGGGDPRSVPHPLGLKGWTHLSLSSSIVTDSRRVNPRSLQRRMRHLIHFLDWIRSALVGIALSSPAPCSALYRERENIVHIKHESGDVQTHACIHCKTLPAQNACASARRQKSHTSLSRGTQTRRLHDEAAVLEGSLSRVHPAVRQQRQQLQDACMHARQHALQGTLQEIKTALPREGGP